MNEFHFRRATGIVLAGVPSTQGQGQRFCWKGLLVGSVLHGARTEEQEEEARWLVLSGLPPDPTRTVYEAL